MISENMDWDEIKFVRLSIEHDLSSFDCGDSDLNDFLIHDAKVYQDGLVAVTYLVEHHDKVVGYFSLSNDKLSVKDCNKSNWRKIKRQFCHSKHRGDYPAVKVGRLAVGLDYQGYDIGSRILDFIKYSFIEKNRTGCVFVTVDALTKAVDFYLKNKFKLLDSGQESVGSQTVSMYYNLLELV